MKKLVLLALTMSILTGTLAQQPKTIEQSPVLSRKSRGLLKLAGAAACFGATFGGYKLAEKTLVTEVTRYVFPDVTMIMQETYPGSIFKFTCAIVPTVIAFLGGLTLLGLGIHDIGMARKNDKKTE